MSAPTAPLPSESAPVSGVGLSALWFGLLAAPLAWSAQLMADYALIAHSCFPAAGQRDTLLYPSVATIVLIVSALAILAGIAGIVVAARSYGRVGGDHAADRTQFHDAPIAVGRARFMALAGIASSTLFLGGIVLHTVGILILAPCR
jgi:hypothetical protein